MGKEQDEDAWTKLSSTQQRDQSALIVQDTRTLDLDYRPRIQVYEDFRKRSSIQEKTLSVATI